RRSAQLRVGESAAGRAREPGNGSDQPVISNLPGPPFPLYLAGARLVSMVPLGPPIEGAGLNITVLSYIDRVDWGFIACRGLVPRLQDMAHAVEDAHRELFKAAGHEGRAPPRAQSVSNTT